MAYRVGMMIDECLLDWALDAASAAHEAVPDPEGAEQPPRFRIALPAGALTESLPGDAPLQALMYGLAATVRRELEREFPAAKFSTGWLLDGSRASVSPAEPARGTRPSAADVQSFLDARFRSWLVRFRGDRSPA